MVEASGGGRGACADCGREMVKAKKVYRGRRYCATCYPRLFKPRQCPRCGHMARLPAFDTLAVCTKCFSTRACVRCKRVGRPVGKLTPYGPACNSCAHYFNEPGVCEVCGALSTRLTNTAIGGQVRSCCPRCANTSAATCQRCHRYRVLVVSKSGVSQCKRCSEIGEIACSACGNAMPAGYGHQCWDCYWSRTYRKRLELNVEGFSSEIFRSEFRAYGDWLIGCVGANKAAISINRHMVFFVEMAEKWEHLPSYAELLAFFGADRLRRAQLPVRWMVEQRSLEVSEEVKLNYTEQRRIADILSSVSPGELRQMIDGYYDHLKAKTGGHEISWRSMRLALRSAANLLRICNESSNLMPSTTDLKLLLARTPGVLASVTGFVNYLNRSQDLNIDIKQSRDDAIRLMRKNLEHELLGLIREASDGADIIQRWVPAALGYFHGLTKFKQFSITVKSNVDGGMIVEVGLYEYWIPLPSTSLG